MNTNAIRDVATRARRQLMEAVERRCLLYGIEEGAQRDVDTVNGRVLSAGERAQRRELLRMQDELRGDGKPGTGHAALVEQAAYTWFNRLFAIRFMELNDRLPSHVRMLSAQDGSFAPECLREAMDLPLDALDRNETARLVAEGDDEGLFRLILLAQCAELAEFMPGVFERVGSAMELLLPDGLLAKDGVVESLVTGIPEDDWREGVEIVGWAYQFYVSERKDEFFRSKRKAGKSDIAPATQLFTPEYIVRFLVQNSLGRLWVLNNPGSPLVGQMEYFVRPDLEGHEDFRRISSPEDITLIDPACGSGHFLCYAFDLLAAMYEERGYRRRDIPQLILERNLTGVEIDRRAASLTSFALTMKALEWDGRFLRRGVSPRVICIESVELTPEEQDVIGAGAEQRTLVDMLAHLGEIGSLWRPTAEDVAAIGTWLQRAQSDRGLFAGTAMEKLTRMQRYTQVLSEPRLICATNPPYMVTGNLEQWANAWVKNAYKDEKADLCTCFIARGFSLISAGGYNAQVTMQSWMFLSSFENMRSGIVNSKDIRCLAQFGTKAFNAIGGEVVTTAATVFYNGSSNDLGVYIKLTEFAGEEAKSRELARAVGTADSPIVYRSGRGVFESIPTTPIAYWATKAVSDAFTELTKASQIATFKHGMSTGKNDAVVRLWFEVGIDKISLDSSSHDEFYSTQRRFVPYNKGGEYRKWWGNQSFVLGYDLAYDRLMDSFSGHRHDNKSMYFRECISWSKVSSGSLAMRYFPQGFAFDVAGCSSFANHEALIPLMSFYNSSVCMSFLSFLSPNMNFEVGTLDKLPIDTSTLHDDRIVDLTLKNIELARTDWDSFETSWGFIAHPLVRCASISSAYGLWSAECKDRFDMLKANEEQLNAIFARIYHMEGEVSNEVEDDNVSVRCADLTRDVKSLLSYAVGCMFGRYSLDKPGLVLANQGDGLPEYLARVQHPRYMPDDDGILPITDDEYFDDDIVAMLCEWLRKAYGPETLEENLQFVADALGGTGAPRKVIRDYFMNQFFTDHCATYSVPSAGKRPIYWLVDSGKLGGFRALVYMHRYTPDLLARVRTDYVHERQERYRSRIAELGREREGASRREQSAIDKELKRLRAQLDEVTKFEERLHHLADQMIEIDLDDGFKVNYAKFADVMAKVK